MSEVQTFNMPGDKSMSRNIYQLSPTVGLYKYGGLKYIIVTV